MTPTYLTYSNALLAVAERSVPKKTIQLEFRSYENENQRDEVVLLLKFVGLFRYWKF